MTIVVTRLQNTRQAARQLRFEPAVGITAVNIQKAIEQVFGSSGGGVVNPTLVTSTSYVPLATDTVLWVAVAGAAQINLPTAASRNNATILIKDVSGAANSNNITITHAGGDTYGFDGQATLVINAAYGGYRLDPKTIGVSSGWVIDP